MEINNLFIAVGVSDKMTCLDFYIPEEYRGRKIALPRQVYDDSVEPAEKPVELLIQNGAHYLDINPLEDEDEFLGCQDESDRQELNFYDRHGRIISCQDLEHEINTGDLMNKLESLLEAQY